MRGGLCLPYSVTTQRVRRTSELMSALGQKQTFRPVLGLLLVGKGAQVRGASPVKLPRRQFLHLAAGAASLTAVSRIAWAQNYPTRPVRIIVATAPGGLPDILARLIGPWLSGRL